MEGRKSENVKAREGGMRAIEERLRPHLDENVASLWLEKWLQIHAGGHPAVFFSLYRLLRTRKDLTRAVTPDKQVVIEGYPRSGNSFARRAFIMAQGEGFDVTSIAHHLHVPAQVVRAARLRIPTLVLIRRPKDAVLSLVIRDPISVDRALRYYISFYETSEKYRDAYVLVLFEEAQFAQVAHLLSGLFEHRKRSAHCMQAPDDYDHKRLEEESVGEEARSASLSGKGGPRRSRETVDQAHQLNKDGVSGGHRRVYEGSVLGHTSYSRVFRFRSTRLSVSSDIYDQPSTI
jgi:hypothetical protein